MLQRLYSHDPRTRQPWGKPYNSDFTAFDNVDANVRVLDWLTDIMPGLNYRRKPKRLVRWLLSATALPSWEREVLSIKVSILPDELVNHERPRTMAPQHLYLMLCLAAHKGGAGGHAQRDAG